GQDKENARRPFGDFRQYIARPRAEQRVRSTAAEGDARARVLLGQLNQNQKNQQRAVSEQNNCQESCDKTHGRMLNGIFDDVSKPSCLQRSTADESTIHVRLAHQFLGVGRLDASAILDAYLFRSSVVEHFRKYSANESVRVLRLLGRSGL